MVSKLQDSRNSQLLFNAKSMVNEGNHWRELMKSCEEKDGYVGLSIKPWRICMKLCNGLDLELYIKCSCTMSKNGRMVA